MKEKEYSVTEAAELLGVHRVTLWEWIRDKKLPARRMGLRPQSPYLIKEADLIEAAEVLGIDIGSELHEHQS